MFCGIVPGKENIRLFLRRHIIRSNLERERPRTLQECVVEPKRYGYMKTWFVVLTLPVVYYASSVLLRDVLVANTMEPPGAPVFDDKWNEKVRLNSTESEPPKVLFRGRQLRVPHSPAPPLPGKGQLAKASTWQSYWYYQDKMLLWLNVKKKHLKIEKKKFLTSHTLEFTPPPTSTTKRPKTEPCEINHNWTQSYNASLKLYDINKDLETVYPMVQKGGFYKPSGCWSRHRVAVIVPYRNYSATLKVFLYNIHPFLMAQKLEYQIFVIEQFGTNRFNKGRIYNAGFKEIKKWGQWRCVIFHDVDLLPLSLRIFYTCPTFPRHMSSTVLFPNGTDKNITILNRFGGVTAVTIQHYEKVNGHSNIFWGWGLEDFDIFTRFLHAGMPVVRNKKNISMFVEIPHLYNHQRKKKRSSRVLLENAAERSKYEGLSTLEYTVRNLTLHHLYTHIVVDVDPYAFDFDTTESKEISYTPLP